MRVDLLVLIALKQSHATLHKTRTIKVNSAGYLNATGDIINFMTAVKTTIMFSEVFDHDGS